MDSSLTLSPLPLSPSPPSSQTVIDDLSPNGVWASHLPSPGFIANRWMGALEQDFCPLRFEVGHFAPLPCYFLADPFEGP